MNKLGPCRIVFEQFELACRDNELPRRLSGSIHQECAEAFIVEHCFLGPIQSQLSFEDVDGGQSLQPKGFIDVFRCVVKTPSGRTPIAVSLENSLSLGFGIFVCHDYKPSCHLTLRRVRSSNGSSGGATTASTPIAANEATPPVIPNEN